MMLTRGLLIILCAGFAHGSRTVESALDEALLLKSYAACASEVTRQNGSSWCTVVSQLARKWEDCEDVFKHLDSLIAGSIVCELTKNDCGNNLITNPELLPVASVCYESCNEKTGCEEGAFSKAIHASGVCDGATLPAAFTHGLIQLPYGPPLQLIYGLASAFITPTFSFKEDAAFVERYPVTEYFGGFMQSMILLRGLWFGHLALEAVPNTSCGFLVFNLAPVFSSCIVSYTSIIGMLISASYAETDEGSGIPQGLALVCSLLPLGAAALYIVILGVGGVSILVTSIPALVAFIHLVLVQAILLGW
jgi:hypothetical protein